MSCLPYMLTFARALHSLDSRADFRLDLLIHRSLIDFPAASRVGAHLPYGLQVGIAAAVAQCVHARAPSSSLQLHHLFASLFICSSCLFWGKLQILRPVLPTQEAPRCTCSPPPAPLQQVATAAAPDQAASHLPTARRRCRPCSCRCHHHLARSPSNRIVKQDARCCCLRRRGDRQALRRRRAATTTKPDSSVSVSSRMREIHVEQHSPTK